METKEREPGLLLAVDDNEMNRDLLSRRLRKEGHEVVAVENGYEALKILDERAFDLVLLDVMMPGMNGYEVLESIKKTERWRHIPVLMISALTEMDSVVRCIELGADDYLPKPFKTVLLKARVNACLDRKRWRDKESQYLNELQLEKQKSEDLLKVILPEPIIDELKTSNQVNPRRFEDVAVLFCDVVQFTNYCDQHSPEEVLCHLQNLVEAYEGLCADYKIQKIKTIGDAYMAAAGLLTSLDNPVLEATRCAVAMTEAAKQLSCGWEVRVGIHVGPVMAGVVGHCQYQYDIWGDTVNTAARIQNTADSSGVCMSEECWKFISDVAEGDPFTKSLRGKGELNLVRLKSLKDFELAGSES